MKTLLMIAVLILGSSLNAQVKTSGGGGPDLEAPDQRRSDYETKEKLKHVFADLSKELIRIEKKCTGRKNFPKNYNFIDSFYSISLKKSTEALHLGTKCVPSSKTAACLKTRRMKNIYQEIQTYSGTIYLFLEEEYKLDKQSAKIILDYFNVN